MSLLSYAKDFRDYAIEARLKFFFLEVLFVPQKTSLASEQADFINRMDGLMGP